MKIGHAPSSRSEAEREAKFEVEFTELVPFVRAFSSKLIQHRALAEDLAQEALAKAWKARASYQPGTNLKAWLCTILKNEYGSHRRRAWRQVPWNQDVAARVHAPQEEQRWASELTDIRRALVGVCIEQREALILITVAGFSYAEAARITQLPVGTLKSRVLRARAKLAIILEQKETLPRRRTCSDGDALMAFLKQVPLARARSEATDVIGRRNRGAVASA